MKRQWGLLVLWMWAFMMSSGKGLAQEPEITLRVLQIEQAGYHPDDMKDITDVFESLTGIGVSFETVRYETYVDHLSASRTRYDVCALDHIWVADLVERGVLSPLDDYLSRNMRKDLAPGLKEAFVYQGTTWGMPFLLNMQLLFYNERFLKEAGYTKPPDSLETLVEQMTVMKAKGLTEYPWTDAWQQGESLTMEFVWLLAAFGGQVFDQNGQPAFDQKAGVQALEFMRMLLVEELASPRILQQDELAARDDFLAGRAAFTSNWLFMQALLDGAGAMHVLPASETVTPKTASVISTQGLAIPADSSHKEAAWQWIQFFTSPLVQRAFGYEMPVWTSVQISETMLFMDPSMPMKRNQLLSATLRPNLPEYGEVSAHVQTAIYQALLGELDPAAALLQAKTEVQRVLAR